MRLLEVVVPDGAHLFMRAEFFFQTKHDPR